MRARRLYNLHAVLGAAFVDCSHRSFAFEYESKSMRMLFLYSMASVDVLYLLRCLTNAIFTGHRDRTKGWQTSDTQVNLKNYLG